MSYFDDQFDAWMENDCVGSPDMYDPHSADTFGAWVNPAQVRAAKRGTQEHKRSRSQKRRAQRKRAEARKKAQCQEAK